MPLAIDGSSPARVSGAQAAGAATTASFDPPAGVLVACVGGDGAGDLQVTMSSNGTALTWVPIATRNSIDSGGLNGVAQAHYALLSAGRTGMTVTATLSVLEEVTLKLYVVTAADSTSPVGGTAEGSTASQTFTTTGFTTVGDSSSLGFVVANDYDNVGAPTSSDTTIDAYSMGVGGVSGMSGYKALGTAGSSATFAVAGGVGPAWNWVSFEIEAASPGYNPPTDIPANILIDPASVGHPIVAVTASGG